MAARHTRQILLVDSDEFMLDLLKTGTLALPAGDVREPFVDVEDIEIEY